MRVRNIALLSGALLCLIGLASCGARSAGAPDKQAEAEAQIREIERQWAETAVTGDTSVIDRILADDFLGTSPEGKPYTKQEFINEMQAHPSEFTSNQSGINKTRNEYVAAWKAASADQITGLYTEDAVVLYPNQAALSGEERDTRLLQVVLH